MQSELQLQSECFQWSWKEFPKSRRLFWAVPNGGLRTMLDANNFKASGVIEGIWDSHLFYHNKLYIFEFKVGKNTLTIDHVDKKGKKHFGQKEWGCMMELHGAEKYVIRDFEQFKRIFAKLMNYE